MTWKYRWRIEGVLEEGEKETHICYSFHPRIIIYLWFVKKVMLRRREWEEKRASEKRREGV